MSWLTGFLVFEVAFTSAACLAGWAYQASKSEEQQTADLLRDTEDPRLASYLESIGGPPMTAWDLFIERAPIRRLANSMFGNGLSY